MLNPQVTWKCNGINKIHGLPFFIVLKWHNQPWFIKLKTVWLYGSVCFPVNFPPYQFPWVSPLPGRVFKRQRIPWWTKISSQSRATSNWLTSEDTSAHFSTVFIMPQLGSWVLLQKIDLWCTRKMIPEGVMEALGLLFDLFDNSSWVAGSGTPVTGWGY